MTSSPGGAAERPWFVGTQNDDLFIINKPPRPSHDSMADIPDVAVIARMNACNDEANAAMIVAAVNIYNPSPDSKLEAYRKALEEAPIMSKYHGMRGFETERFIADYEAWREVARKALAAGG